MGRQLLQPQQIAGINRDTLYDEIIGIIEKVKRYKSSVVNTGGLPALNNVDGDIRLVLSEDEFYMWDATTKSWCITHDKKIERKTFSIAIDNDNQVSFSTPVSLGNINGFASISTIDLIVNGMIQAKGIDYDTTYDLNQQYPVQLQWLSSDFSLEKTDTLTIVADILSE